MLTSMFDITLLGVKYEYEQSKKKKKKSTLYESTIHDFIT